LQKLTINLDNDYILFITLTLSLQCK